MFRQKILALAALAALIGATIPALTPALAARHSTPCGSNKSCRQAPHGLSLKFFVGKYTHSAVLKGWDWRPGALVDVRVSQHLGTYYWNRNKLPAITGLEVRTNRSGAFKVVMPQLGFCDFIAQLSASYPGGRGEVLPRGSGGCMEYPEPMPPVDVFRVPAGRYIRTVFAAASWQQRYELTLTHQFRMKSAIRESAAIRMARADAHAGSSAPATARKGQTVIGLAAHAAEVREVVVSRVRIPHYGIGHKVVIIDDETPYTQRGRILASWNAP